MLYGEGFLPSSEDPLSESTLIQSEQQEGKCIRLYMGQDVKFTDIFTYIYTENPPPLKNLKIVNSRVCIENSTTLEVITREFNILEILSDLQVVWKWESELNACCECKEPVQSRK